ncbi:MAG: glycosyltransferase family 1 protein [Acidobacteria bacterium]|nr:glycosyltransferase family 1 protein [Acidobacteriota bacterium]
MTTSSKGEGSGRQRRTLIFSQRNLSSIQPFRCAHFEFEDVIAEIDNVELLAPSFDPNTRRQRVTKQLAYHTPLALNPGIEKIELDEQYELFFAICGNPTDILRISSAVNWRKSCKKAVCLIDEMWAKDIPNYRNYLRAIAQFDLVVLYYSRSVAPANQIMGQEKCVFLPPGVDAVRFCPYPDAPGRSIHVYSVGRRSAVTHKSFLRMASNDGTLYLHDTTSADRVLDPIEHRILVSNLAKRSRYYIVNPGLIDRPDVRGDQIEIGNRYFEGAAAGNILLGERPQNGEFEKFFDWNDSLIDLPYNSPEADQVIRDLDAQPERQLEIQRRNVQQSLQRHDWAHRWESILRLAGMDCMPGLANRKKKLQSLSDQVMGNRAAVPKLIQTGTSRHSR